MDILTDSSGRAVIGSLLVGEIAWISASDVELLVIVYRIHRNAFVVAFP